MKIITILILFIYLIGFSSQQCVVSPIKHHPQNSEGFDDYYQKFVYWKPTFNQCFEHLNSKDNQKQPVYIYVYPLGTEPIEIDSKYNGAFKVSELHIQAFRNSSFETRAKVIVKSDMFLDLNSYSGNTYIEVRDIDFIGTNSSYILMRLENSVRFYNCSFTNFSANIISSSLGMQYENCQFYNNFGTDSGIVSNQNIYLNQCSFISNKYQVSLVFSRRQVYSTQSLFQNNHAVKGLINSVSDTVINSNIFRENQVLMGGAVYISGDCGRSNGDCLVVTSSEFSSNIAYDYGGAIFIQKQDSSHPIQIIDSTFSNNSANSGSAIYIEEFNLYVTGLINLTGSRFYYNTAYNDGSTIYNRNSPIYIKGSFYEYSYNPIQGNPDLTSYNISNPNSCPDLPTLFVKDQIVCLAGNSTCEYPTYSTYDENQNYIGCGVTPSSEPLLLPSQHVTITTYISYTFGILVFITSYIFLIVFLKGF